MSKDVKEKIDELKPWFHNIHLPGEIQTAPDHFLGDFPKFKWEKIKDSIPEDLTGWKILDIGCNAGYYTFELAKRGAKVTGIDLDTHYLAQAKWLAGELGLEDKVNFRQLQVYDLMNEDTTYDMIWFMGVFYHLRYPLLALDIVAQKTSQKLVFQTLALQEEEEYEPKEDYLFDERIVLEAKGWPKMSFIENRFAGDPTNWWVPNVAAIKAMLRSSGFEIKDTPIEETFICNRKSGDGVMSSWNKSEFLSATGRSYNKELDEKIYKGKE
ncbi:MAG: TIGR04290 family methyltransferase [Candidatus Cyclobacteriaceae bacterium M2_1C_046]